MTSPTYPEPSDPTAAPPYQPTFQDAPIAPPQQPTQEITPAPQYPTAPQYPAQPDYPAAPQYAPPAQYTPQYPTAPLYPPAHPYAAQYPSAPHYPGPQYPGMPGQPYIVPSPPTSSAATASLVLGIAGVLIGACLLGLPCLLAVVFGHIGLIQTRNNERAGRGMAIAGLVLGYVVIIPAAIFSIVFWIGIVRGVTTGQ